MFEHIQHAIVHDHGMRVFSTPQHHTMPNGFELITLRMLAHKIQNNLDRFCATLGLIPIALIQCRALRIRCLEVRLAEQAFNLAAEQ